MTHDLFDWSNMGVSVVGLALTFGALRQAQGAKEAARQARSAIRQRNTVDSIEEIVRLSKEFAYFVEYERRAEAMVFVREIILRLARVRGEFEHVLASDTDKLREIESRFKTLADELSRLAVPLGSQSKRELFRETLDIVQESSAILGRVRHQANQEGK